MLGRRSAAHAPVSTGTLRIVAAAALGAATIAGCAPASTERESAPNLTVVATTAPLHAPTWSHARSAVLALTDDGRVARVSDPAAAERSDTAFSTALHAGANLWISDSAPTQVWVPQPRDGRVTAVDVATLRPVAEVAAGPAPAQLSANAGLRTLLVLSADGQSVTPVDEYSRRPSPTATITGPAAETIIGAARGRRVDYHLYDASGVRHLRGATATPEQLGALPITLSAATADHTKNTRSYVGQNTTVWAVDARRDGRGMQIVGRLEVPGGPVRFLASDDTRLYVATDRAVVVAATASVTGYPDGRIPLRGTVDYRSVLPAGPARDAPLSGVAVGPHRIYLTVAGEPYLISVAKPAL